MPVRQRQEVQALPRQARLNADTFRNAPRELITARLTLQAPRPEHAPAFVACLNASLAEWRYISYGQVARELAWAQEFCARALQFVEEGDCLIFNAFETTSGACIGRVDLHTIDLAAQRAEIGYVGNTRLRGRGLMREAVLTVVDLAFALGFERIEAISDARNEHAIRFAQGLGFEREGLLRRHERDPQGLLCDMVVLSLLKPGDPHARSSPQPSPPPSA